MNNKMKKKIVTVPRYIGAEAFYRNGRPCCPVGHILEAYSIVPKKYKNAAIENVEYTAHQYISLLTWKIMEDLYKSGDPRSLSLLNGEDIEDDLADLSTSIDSTKSQAKRHQAFRSFIEKYRTIFSIEQGSSQQARSRPSKASRRIVAKRKVTNR